MKILIIWGILILLNIIGKIYLHYLDYKIDKDIRTFNSLDKKDNF